MRTSVRGVYACYPRTVQVEDPDAHVYETYWEMIYNVCICARSQGGFNMMDIKYGQITFFSTWVTLSPMLLDIKLLVMMQLKRGLSALGQRHMLLTQMRMFSRRTCKLKASNARGKKNPISNMGLVARLMLWLSDVLCPCSQTRL